MIRDTLAMQKEARHANEAHFEFETSRGHPCLELEQSSHPLAAYVYVKHVQMEKHSHEKKH